MRTQSQVIADITKLMWEYYGISVGSMSDYEEEWLPPYLEDNKLRPRWFSSNLYYEALNLWLAGDGLERAGY